MAKDKDRTLNPATAALKADKARALKKGKAAITAQRTERLASRNPARLERQIAELKDVASGGGREMGGREKKQVEELERQLGLVRRAREKVGVKGRDFGDRGGRGRGGGSERGKGGGVLGKRARGHGERTDSGSETGSETDESVRRIPMPRDTPPPIPSQHQRDRQRGRHRAINRTSRDGHDTRNANTEPLGPGRGRDRLPHALPPKPEAPIAAVPKTTYEAKPVVRDLRKEAVKAFMPAVVARKVQAVKGDGGRLLEEEEVERLEREGYLGGGRGGGSTGVEVVSEVGPTVGERVGDEEKRRLEEEEERFRREVRMEEVSDEDL
ncbi:MAG: hypothetical protein Q9204_006025 [Flavoplaca sp. TL-2023a]